MVAGRKPVPAETRRKRGESDRKLPVVVGGRNAPPRPPEMFPEMAQAWDYIVADLLAAHAIDHADAGVIEAAAEMWGLAREARAEMNKRRAKPRPSLLISTPQGSVPNRLLTISSTAWKEFRALAESLPLSPWGRARLGLKAAEPPETPDKDIPAPKRLRVVGDGD